jgi:hypothetical protein
VKLMRNVTSSVFPAVADFQTPIGNDFASSDVTLLIDQTRTPASPAAHETGVYIGPYMFDVATMSDTEMLDLIRMQPESAIEYFSGKFIDAGEYWKAYLTRTLY